MYFFNWFINDGGLKKVKNIRDNKFKQLFSVNGQTYFIDILVNETNYCQCAISTIRFVFYRSNRAKHFKTVISGFNIISWYQFQVAREPCHFVYSHYKKPISGGPVNLLCIILKTVLVLDT